MLVRKAELKDISELKRIVLDAFDDNAGVGEFICLIDSAERKAESVAANFGVTDFLVAEVDGRVVGFVEFLVVEWVCLVFNLFVEKKFQGKGIGGKLIEEASKGCVEVRVVVSKNNAKALGFYKSLGFKEEVGSIGLRKKL